VIIKQIEEIRIRYDIRSIYVNCMQQDTTFIKNEGYMHIEGHVWMPSTWQKKSRFTQEETVLTTPMNTEQTWMPYALLLIILWYWYIQCI
jgi:hypothetical protein